MHPGVAGIKEEGIGPGGSAGTRRTIKAGGNISTSAALTYPEEFEIKMLVNNMTAEQRAAGGYMKPLFIRPSRK